MQAIDAIARKFRGTASVSAIALMLTACASLDLKPEPTRVEPQAVAIDDVPPPQDWVVPAPDALPSTDQVREFPDPILISLLYTSPSPRDRTRSRMPSSA